MTVNSLQELFVSELKDLYDAEHQLIDALPKLSNAATAPELHSAFEEHLMQTREHIRRLEDVFAFLDMKPSRKSCEGMKGIVKEAGQMMDEVGPGMVMDAGLIASAQKTEHYEMAGYGTLRTYAYLLGYQNVATALQKTLDEEEQTDKKLTQLANDINVEAMATGR